MLNICKQLRDGDQVHHFFLIKEAEKRTGSNGNYLDLTLGDQTGQINAKLWSCSDVDVETFVVQQIVLVKGYVKSYREKPQLTIQQMRLAIAEDKVRLEDLIRSAPGAPVDMYAKLMAYIDQIKNADIQAILRKIVEKREEKLFSHPAGMKNHHDFYGGLLYHITSMLDLALLSQGSIRCWIPICCMLVSFSRHYEDRGNGSSDGCRERLHGTRTTFGAYHDGDTRSGEYGKEPVHVSFAFA